MKKIKYILAAAVAALALSTSAFAVGDVVDGIENGAEDIIDGAGDAADDILGDGSDDGTGDGVGGDNVGDGADDTVGDDNAEATTEDTTAPDDTTMSEITTADTVVSPDKGDNRPTGFVLGFSALGAAAAGLTALAARKRK